MEPYDPPTTVLVQRSEPQGVSTVLSSTDFFQSKRNRRLILDQVDSFQLRDKYLFATTTRVRGPGAGPEEPSHVTQLFQLRAFHPDIAAAALAFSPQRPAQRLAGARSMFVLCVCRGWTTCSLPRRRRANRPASRWQTQFGSSSSLPRTRKSRNVPARVSNALRRARAPRRPQRRLARSGLLNPCGSRGRA